ncbi:ABC transporter ATP-binding protein, partial [Xanthomonas citri pv. citri]|nr:ABC transporter ATP-binding protein [Xanthomonas citri pv. citri]
HPQNYKITYLTQEPDFNPKASILDSVLDDSLPQMRAIKNYEAALLDFENLSKLERAQSEMDALNAWQVEADVKTILTKLQLPEATTII